MSKIYVSVKYQIQYSCIICDKLLPFKRRFRDSQIVIITKFVVVASVGIKMDACILQSYAFRRQYLFSEGQL